MKNLIHGQSYISTDCPIIGQDGQAVIVQDEKRIDDIDISECAMLFETKKQRHERIVKRYEKMLAEKELNRQCPENAYNLRVLNYPYGQQLTYYTNSVAYHNKPHEKLERSYHNSERTDEEREHCINVSLARTKNTIYNIARSHNWKWFVTFTFNRTKTNAGDFKAVMKRMARNLNNTKQRKCPNLKYLVVPELHLDNTNYHFHGLFSGCDELQFVFSGHFDKKGRPVFNIPNWSWGFSTATLVDDSAAASNYICKYITKETEHYLFGQRRYLSNAPKTEAEKHFVWNSKREVMESCADDIRYMKEIVVKEAHRKITIMELPPDTMEITYEIGDTESPDNSKENRILPKPPKQGK